MFDNNHFPSEAFVCRSTVSHPIMSLTVSICQRLLQWIIGLKRSDNLALTLCWAKVADVGPTLTQREGNRPCFSHYKLIHLVTMTMT